MKEIKYFILFKKGWNERWRMDGEIYCDIQKVYNVRIFQRDVM